MNYTGLILLLVGGLALFVFIIIGLFAISKEKYKAFALIGVIFSAVIFGIGSGIVIFNPVYDNNDLYGFFESMIYDDYYYDYYDEDYYDDYADDNIINEDTIIGNPNDETMTYSLSSGLYTVGIDIYEGVYDINLPDSAWVYTSNGTYIDGEIGTGKYDNVKFGKDTVIYIETEVEVTLVSKQLYGVLEPIKTKGETIALKDGIYRVGSDIDEGTYTLTVDEVLVTLTFIDYDYSYDFGTSASLGPKYVNFAFDEGDLIEIRGGSIIFSR